MKSKTTPPTVTSSITTENRISTTEKVRQDEISKNRIIDWLYVVYFMLGTGVLFFVLVVLFIIWKIKNSRRREEKRVKSSGGFVNPTEPNDTNVNDCELGQSSAKTPVVQETFKESTIRTPDIQQSTIRTPDIQLLSKATLYLSDDTSAAAKSLLPVNQQSCDDTSSKQLNTHATAVILVMINLKFCLILFPHPLERQNNILLTKYSL